MNNLMFIHEMIKLGVFISTSDKRTKNKKNAQNKKKKENVKVSLVLYIHT